MSGLEYSFISFCWIFAGSLLKVSSSFELFIAIGGHFLLKIITMRHSLSFLLVIDGPWGKRQELRNFWSLPGAYGTFTPSLLLLLFALLFLSSFLIGSLILHAFYNVHLPFYVAFRKKRKEIISFKSLPSLKRQKLETGVLAAICHWSCVHFRRNALMFLAATVNSLFSCLTWIKSQIYKIQAGWTVPVNSGPNFRPTLMSLLYRQISMNWLMHTFWPFDMTSSPWLMTTVSIAKQDGIVMVAMWIWLPILALLIGNWLGRLPKRDPKTTTENICWFQVPNFWSGDCGECYNGRVRTGCK